ncbi:hypothetical protein AB6A40_004984 [Gnathostoma spinigerum]|uniref:Uncharacterized protein n=1 Tax=Gnathostoma spinigerum TaxID=75299 RepID=A0ABD6EE34_9BILA
MAVTRWDKFTAVSLGSMLEWTVIQKNWLDRRLSGERMTVSYVGSFVAKDAKVDHPKCKILPSYKGVACSVKACKRGVMFAEGSMQHPPVMGNRSRRASFVR